ncbi:MAG: cobalt-precorrin-6A reductase [Pseudomonadota bacterium]
MSRILLLGGTGDARRLAARLSDWPVIASLAGATTDPAAYACKTRLGGFGGAEAMADWLRANKIAAIIDATHPYATTISANAVSASRETQTPLIRVDRPPWRPEPGETWIDVASAEEAAGALPSGTRAFLATGRTTQAAFTARGDVWIALRTVDPQGEFPGNGAYIAARPPFEVEDEVRLFTELGITHLVVKNAGGTAARTKLTAASRLGLPIVIIARPSEDDIADLAPPHQIEDWLRKVCPTDMRVQ